MGKGETIVNEEVIKMLNECLKDMIENNENMLEREMSKALNRKAKISVETFGDGKAKTKIEGDNLAILIALAGLEQKVLKSLNTPKSVWEMVKNIVGTRDIK